MEEEEEEEEREDEERSDSEKCCGGNGIDGKEGVLVVVASSGAIAPTGSV